MGNASVNVKLLNKVKEYEERAKELLLKASVLRDTLAELTGERTQAAQATIDKKLKQASALRASNGTSPFAGMNRNELKHARSKAIAAFMVTNHETKLSTIKAHLAGLGFSSTTDSNTLRHDLLALGAKSHRAKGAPLASTTYTLTPKKRDTRDKSRSATKERREGTAKMLQLLSDHGEPVPTTWFPDPRGISVLVQAGYIKKTGDGYVRTAKEFTV